jgi:hypothetical protein
MGLLDILPKMDAIPAADRGTLQQVREELEGQSLAAAEDLIPFIRLKDPNRHRGKGDGRRRGKSGSGGPPDGAILIMHVNPMTVTTVMGKTGIELAAWLFALLVKSILALPGTEKLPAIPPPTRAETTVRRELEGRQRGRRR